MFAAVGRAEDTAVVAGIDHILICRVKSKGMLIDMDRCADIGEGRTAVGRFVDRASAEINDVWISRINSKNHVAETLVAASCASCGELRPCHARIRSLPYAE